MTHYNFITKTYVDLAGNLDLYTSIQAACEIVMLHNYKLSRQRISSTKICKSTTMAALDSKLLLCRSSVY